MTLDITQWGAALLGLPALLLVQYRDNRRRVLLGMWLGLASQGFWIWGTWRGGLWGWLALSLAYTAVWGRGIWVNRRGN